MTWRTTTLGDLFDLKYGKALPERNRVKTGLTMVYGSNGIVGYHDKVITKGPTIVVGRKGSAGRIAYSATPCWPIDTTYFVDDFGDSHDPRFWAYQFRSLRLDELEKSSAVPGLNRDDAYTRDCSYPDNLDEQRRIANKLDQIAARLADTKARLDTIPTILKRFFMSVLAAACSGRLTEEWRTERGLPEWTETTLGTLTSLVTSGSRGWAKYYVDRGATFIRAQNINTDRLVLDDVAHVRVPTSAEGARTRVNKHDLLVTITGANVTKTALVQCTLGEAYVSQHVALVRLADSTLAPFVFLWLSEGAPGRSQLLESAYGAGKPGLNLGNIRDIQIKLPSMVEQKEMIKRVRLLLNQADAIEARYRKAHGFTDKLMPSVLAKAFRGELVEANKEEVSHD